MASSLIELRDSLSKSLEELLDERDKAFAKGETDKVTTAEAEAERLGVVLATVQFAINNNEAMNLNAVAKRLEESIEAQRAIGLSTAAKTLEKAAMRVRNAIGGVAQPSTQPSRGGGHQRRAVEQPVSGAVQAKPGKHQSVVNKLIAGALAQGLDPMMVLTIVAIESDFNPTATSRLSSAGGLFQFIDATWLKEGGKKSAGGGGKGNGHAASAPIDDQVEIGCKFIAKNIADLKKKLATSPTTVMVYMAHQQGLAGALKILQGDPNEAIESVIGDEAARNNAFSGLTVAETIAKFRTMVRVNEDEANAVVIPAAPAGGPTAPAVSSTIARKAVEVALAELEMFGRSNGAIVTETSPPLGTRVLEYFRFVGRPDIVNPAAEPWSAAFISFVMHQAGANAQFPKSAAHAKYILTGVTNRMNNRFDAPVVYFDRDEKAPKVGDLIGFSRTSAVKSRADIEAFLSKPPDQQFFPSHTDLVIDVSPGKIRVIGGNVSQTIMTKSVKADADGKIDPSEAHFFVLRTNF